MVKKLLLTLLAAVAVSGAMAQVEFNSIEPTKLIEMGKDKGKLIFVDVYATWCPPCKMMESQVFSRKDVGDFMSANFISGKYNIDQKIGGELADKYGIYSIPTYLVFNGDGEIVTRIIGGLSAEDFIAKMKEIL